MRRDRNKRVVEVWVRWLLRDYLYDSGAGDRHYLLERSRGRLILHLVLAVIKNVSGKSDGSQNYHHQDCFHR